MDHIFRKDDKIKKGIGESMSGKVWQLGSQRLREEVREQAQTYYKEFAGRQF